MEAVRIVVRDELLVVRVRPSSRRVLICTLPCQKVISLLLAATLTWFVSDASETVPLGKRWSSERARAGTNRSSSARMVLAPGRSRIAMRYESVATIRNDPSTRDTRTPVNKGRPSSCEAARTT